MTCVYNLYKPCFQLLSAKVKLKHKSEPARCHTTVYYLYLLSTMLEVRTLFQVCLGLKIDLQIKIMQISLTCQTVSFGHLEKKNQIDKGCCEIVHASNLNAISPCFVCTIATVIRTMKI